MATNTYLVITDGTTTATIADGSGGSVSGNYRLVDESWAPAVAGLRRSPFGGVGPYEDVAESMDVAVSGSTVAACLSYISTLTNLLHQAERWYRGENVSAVTVRYSPRGATVSSAGSPLQAVILGRAGDAIITLPPTLDDGNTYKAGVRLNFVRRGLWLHNTTSASVSGSNGVPASITFGSSSTYQSPVDITVTNHYSDYTQYQIIGIGSGSNSIQRFAAGSSAGTPDGSTRWRYSSASGSNPVGSGIIYFGPASTGSGQASTPSTFVSTQGVRYGAIVSLRNISATISYSFKLAFNYLSGTTYLYSSPVNVPVGSSTAQAVYYHLGQFSLSATGSARIWVWATPSGSVSAATSAANALQVENIVIYEEDNCSFFAVRNDHSTGASQATAINHNLLSKLQMTVAASGGFANSHNGTVPFVSGTSAQVILLGTEDIFWRQGATSAATRVNTWTVTRTNGYISPV